MWQYTSSGTVSGISGNVDRDYCYVDYPTKIKSAGKNGYPKTSTTKTVLDTTGFKRGDKSDGVLALKQLLILAGCSVKNDRGFGSGTEIAVNKLLKKWGYKENGIAGKGFIKKLGSDLK
jgi:hypothetical protein